MKYLQQIAHTIAAPVAAATNCTYLLIKNYFKDGERNNGKGAKAITYDGTVF